ncbi:hypothetical protein K491DRAFT_22005 [Lophiostoma macrostomum CBS 122681]|uniref:Uncharacterized protein n=1 Tax=Lophiostoma macrostomum CBS 122681 TaxID=1314788 RepID=A0A6A6SZH8_9PLEO|nr:hypothetical protein K491DRAFT_22005 [Lophiostoma macrostomum CBS 122681]
MPRRSVVPSLARKHAARRPPIKPSSPSTAGMCDDEKSVKEGYGTITKERLSQGNHLHLRMRLSRHV